MKTLFILLDGAAAPAAQSSGSSMGFWIMMLLLFVVMWLFMIRPQRKQQKEQETFRSNLKKGDKVVTIGGIYGTIAEVDETTVLIKVDGETKLRMAKSSIQSTYTEPQQ